MPNPFQEMLNLFDDETKKQAARTLLKEMKIEPREAEGEKHPPTYAKTTYLSQGGAETPLHEDIIGDDETIFNRGLKRMGRDLDAPAAHMQRRAGLEGSPYSMGEYYPDPMSSEGIAAKYKKSEKLESDPEYLRKEIMRLRDLLKGLGGK